jgi:hypothetical protein
MVALQASALMSGERRMEAESYLSGGYGIRLAIEGRRAGWGRIEEYANVWQPSRLKGTQVSQKFGTPFLAATQVFDLRPISRRFLALSKMARPEGFFVERGMILVTRSGSVGRATLAYTPHEGVLISDDLLRVEAREDKYWGWIYAYLRTVGAREMMCAVQYGHIIKHLEVSHLQGLPIPTLQSRLLESFNERARAVLEARSSAYSVFMEAERCFEEAIGPLEPGQDSELGFALRATELFGGRRRFEGAFYNPAVRTIQRHFAQTGLKTMPLAEAGFDVWLPMRFKRIPAAEGVELVDSSGLFEVNPDVRKRIADGNFGDRHRGRVQAGWLLLARSGQVYGLNGSVVIASSAHDGRVISDHIIRMAPSDHQDVRVGYAYTALSHPTLGRPLVKALAYGSSVPEIDVADLAELEIVRVKRSTEDAIADLSEEGAALLAKADILENAMAADAEDILSRFVAGDMRDVTVRS